MSNTMKEIIAIILVAIMSIFAIVHSDSYTYMTVNAYPRHFVVNAENVHGEKITLHEYIDENGNSILLDNVDDTKAYRVTIDTLSGDIVEKTMLY